MQRISGWPDIQPDNPTFFKIRLNNRTSRAQQLVQAGMVAYPSTGQWSYLKISVAEPHHFYASPAPGKNFDAAPAPTLLYRKAKFLKRTEVLNKC
jgi:hypothetical protein